MESDIVLLREFALNDNSSSNNNGPYGETSHHDVPFGFYSMSARFSDPIFLIAPLLDARFKLLWLDNL
ncbi:unnamed protein product [Rotaria sordida]|uniref:Uncharacterized protein n=1 Tax=Rotaria sordida TaxID=392033 RepID=A0A818SGD5_9BILA|nr:unnamed protein product [Rotaria sordida]